MRILRWSVVSLSLLLLLGMYAGCDEASTASGEVEDASAGSAASCAYDGSVYGVGESFDAGDGCNSCTCESDGSIACTEMYCAPLCDPESCGEVPVGDALNCTGGGKGAVGDCEEQADGTCGWTVTCDGDTVCAEEDCGDEPDVASCPDGSSPLLTCEPGEEGACGWVIGGCGGGGQEDDEGQCVDLVCGDECDLCNPSAGEDCETGVMMGVCDGDGVCVPTLDEGVPCEGGLCDEVICPIADVACDGNKVISQNWSCDPLTGECVAEELPLKDCSEDGMICQEGSCVEDEACIGEICPMGYSCLEGVCEWDPCLDAACGAACDSCDLEQPDCMPQELPMFCDSQGQCVLAFDAEEECGVDLCADVECIAEAGYCENGVAYPGATSVCDPANGECVNGEAPEPVKCEAGEVCEEGNCVGVATGGDAEKLCNKAGGMWDECGSGCGPVTCTNTPDPTGPCPEVCVPQCTCPKSTPIWDDELGCITSEECEVDLCADVDCKYIDPYCDGDVAYAGVSSKCDPKTGECMEPAIQIPEDCGAMGMVCLKGACLKPGETDQTKCGVTGGTWTLCGSGCGPETCEQPVNPGNCPEECIELCECPKEKPIWDPVAGCVELASCDNEDVVALCKEECKPIDPYCEGDVAYGPQDAKCNPQTGECKYDTKPLPVDCGKSGMVCDNGKCVMGEENDDKCANVECPEPTEPSCDGDLALSSTFYACDSFTGQCVPSAGAPPQDCGAMGMTCQNGDCVSKPLTEQDICAFTDGIWVECGSGCGPATCDNPKPGPICPTVCVSQCGCPADAPLWDDDLGCIGVDECDTQEL